MITDVVLSMANQTSPYFSLLNSVKLNADEKTAITIIKNSLRKLING